MADKLFNLDIVTPRKIVFTGEVESFSAPGVVGGFQVLYNHAPMISEIGVGEVKVRDAQGNEFSYATSGGFVEVKNNQVALLAESAERPGEIDLARAEVARERASKLLSERTNETDIERARHSLERAANRIKVAKKV